MQAPANTCNQTHGKWIHLKMWPTKKLHNFLRSTTSILIVSTFEVEYKIWILNLKTSHEYFYGEMISNQKNCQLKVLLHFKTYNFYFCSFSIQGSLKIQITKFHFISRPTTFIVFDCWKKILGKEALYLVSKNIRQKISLPSVKKLGKETLCRVSKIKHSAKSFFVECFILPRIF